MSHHDAMPPETSMPGGDPPRSEGDVAAERLPLILRDASALCLDVREADEYAHERIAGTVNLPLSRLGPSLAQLPKDRDLYVLCQTGVRTPQAVERLRSAGFSRLHAVTGGLRAWKKAGLPVEGRGPLPVMRQVQIVAGSLALLGGAIPGAHWLAALVGAGLVFAGVTGTCAMASVLRRLPWNRRGGGACS